MHSTLPRRSPKVSSFLSKWGAVEAVPIVGIVTFVTLGGTFLLYRAAQKPDVVWTNANSQPWQTIGPDQNSKLMNVNQKYTGGNWHRERW
ncbi:hypothetical protein DL96DRAFT_1582127 [Flagelloscypha sp. PMI_526]|nr:hypothetical protein DL96DRAFT_1582127 [Flagelloscypha sp. PMI_526]